MKNRIQTSDSFDKMMKIPTEIIKKEIRIARRIQKIHNFQKTWVAENFKNS